MEKTILVSMFYLLTASSNIFANDSIFSGGLEFKLSDEKHVNQYKRSIEKNDGIYQGLIVTNEMLNIKGIVSGGIIIKTTEVDSLSFKDSSMSVVKIGGGYWLLKYKLGTEMNEKLAWIKGQSGVQSAEIEVIKNIQNPN